jgi:hypothetical protein
MFMQTMRFAREQDAEAFDQHIVDFLNHCEQRDGLDDACLFASSERDAGHHIRILKTDSARMLGRLKNFLKVRDVSMRLDSSSDIVSTRVLQDALT